jgi:hypothetical protein
MRAVIKFSGILSCFLLLLVISCSSTKLKSVWKDKGYTGGVVNTVLIVGVSEEIGIRRMFEDEFVRQFQSNGVKAVSSAAVVSRDKNLNKDIIIETAKKLGLETIFVTHYIGSEETTVYHPPEVYIVPGSYHSFGMYYPRVYGYVHSPGYYANYENVNLESSLYETKTEKLIWSVKSQTVDPKSEGEIFESLSKAVVNNLRKNKLIE